MKKDAVSVDNYVMFLLENDYEKEAARSLGYDILLDEVLVFSNDVDYDYIESEISVYATQIEHEQS